MTEGRRYASFMHPGVDAKEDHPFWRDRVTGLLYDQVIADTDHDLLDLVLSREPATVPTSKKADYERVSKKVYRVLIQILPPILLSIVHLNGKELGDLSWRAINDELSSGTATSRAILRFELLRIAKKPGESILQYTSRVRMKANGLTASGDTVVLNDEWLIALILLGLPDDFAVVRDKVLQASESLNLNQLLAMLKDHEASASKLNSAILGLESINLSSSANNVHASRDRDRKSCPICGPVTGLANHGIKGCYAPGGGAHGSAPDWWFEKWGAKFNCAKPKPSAHNGFRFRPRLCLLRGVDILSLLSSVLPIASRQYLVR